MPFCTPAGVTEFIKLKDTPASYSGQGGKASLVKATEDGLEFGTVEAAPAGFDSKVSAYRDATNQSIPAFTWTKVEYNAELYDGLGEYDHITNYSFTPQSLGYYLVTTQLQFSVGISDKYIMIGIFKNGILQVRSFFWTTTIQDFTSHVTQILFIDTGDVVDIRVYPEAASEIVYSKLCSYLNIHRLS